MISTLMSNLPGMAYRCRNDRNWTLEFASEGCLELTGYQPSDLLENRISYGQHLIHPDDQEPVWDSVREALRVKESFQLTYRIRTASGEEKWVWEQGRWVFSPGGELMALEGFITDITERKQAEELLEEYAVRDILTNLYNRRHFINRIVEEIARAHRNQCIFAVLLCDLDHFKAINDHRGHLTGDEVLKAVAKSIQDSVRETDLVFRWGGDEMVVILAETTREGCRIAAERIQRGMLKVQKETRTHVDISIGISLYPAHGSTPDDLIRVADLALYTAKKGKEKINIGGEGPSAEGSGIEQEMDPDARPITQGNGPDPAKVDKKGINPPGLAHDRNPGG